MQEIFKDIKGYKGRYQVGNLGNVKSLPKPYSPKNNIMVGGVDGCGYRQVTLCKNGETKTLKVAHLVWDHFGDKLRNGHILQIDHIDGNKLNNKINNLQLLTNRENVSKACKVKKTTSSFTGVSWDKKKKKWMSCIRINGKSTYLGRYKDELSAHLAYKTKLMEIELLESLI